MTAPYVIHPVPIVGASRFQPAIRRCSVGEEVTFEFEGRNPADPRMIAVRSSLAEVVGYLPRGGWLTASLLDLGEQAAASIASIELDHRGLFVIVLNVATGRRRRQALFGSAAGAGDERGADQ